MGTTIVPASMDSPICPYCGCSLVRLGIGREAATGWMHEGQELLFCCDGCLAGFQADPDRYLVEIRDWIVCPTCLAEKPKALTLSIAHEGREIAFCRCPGCVEEFERRPDELLARLAG
jgi:YHS domain-containing protein